MSIATHRRLRWLNGLLPLSLLSQLLSSYSNQVLGLGCLELTQLCYQTVVRRWRRPLCQAPFHYQLARLIRWLVRTWSRWLGRGYGWLLLLMMPQSARYTTPLLMGSLMASSRQGRPDALQLEVETAKGARSWWPIPCQVAALMEEQPGGDWLFSGVRPAVGSIQLVQDQESLRLLVQGMVLLEVPRSDRTGQRWLLQLLLRQELVPSEAAADLLGLSLRTVQRDQATYQQEGDSACLVDRRRFGLGQRTAYRVAEHAGELISQWVSNLLTDEPNNGRHLEAQLAGLFDDRTIDRALERLGMSAAEAAGVRQRVQFFLKAVRQAAYWAGVEQRPLEEAMPPLPEEGWEQQGGDRVTLSLATLHLVSNGVYEAARGLLAKRKGLISATRAWHTLLTHLVSSGGARLSQAKQRAWTSLRGLLGGRLVGVSSSFLRQWVLEVAEKGKEKVTVQRSDGREETITCLRAYLEESVAQRVRRGLVKAQAIWLDCYVNGVSRKEAVARAWHGTKHWAVKAFRRNIAQDVETGQAVTCPLSPSDVTPLWVLQQVVGIINGGLDRAGVAYRLARVTADRWWSVGEVLTYCLEQNLGLLCWAKAVKTVLEALETIDEEDPDWKPIKKEVLDADSGQVKEEVVGYQLETELTAYGLAEPLRVIVDWDGEAGGRKIARLAVRVTETTMGMEAVCDELRFRQRVEILLKFLQRWLQLPNFGGGKAIERPDERVCPSGEEPLKKLETERKATKTRMRNAQTRLEQVEAELEHLTTDEKQQPRNSLGLRVQDLRSLGKRLRGQIERATAKLQELKALIAWGKGQGPAPERETEYELDLTREAILTQLKLDVFTAYETLVEEFIELALKPVLREEAERQAAERRRLDKRSTAKDREGEPLCTSVETLYQIKVANLERETILKLLLNQPGRHLYHPGEKILVTVAQRFSDGRIQAAYERYCLILNQKQIRVPIDEGEEWLLLFTYEKPSSSGDKFK